MGNPDNSRQRVGRTVALILGGLGLLSLYRGLTASEHPSWGVPEPIALPELSRAAVPGASGPVNHPASLNGVGTPKAPTASASGEIDDSNN